ncbi:hypothetical protein AVEN_81483-1 [Araneus ventricosus]|uniref:Uncharacterized protein n=1 Tax=Araneus ventricosus TaxID=182803 RepID=A0A4Y2E3W1_ARAVE|nr:hypothetical protein AVEN_81483-1 [Araneus ventricosus]
MGLQGIVVSRDFLWWLERSGEKSLEHQRKRVDRLRPQYRFVCASWERYVWPNSDRLKFPTTQMDLRETCYGNRALGSVHQGNCSRQEFKF